MQWINFRWGDNGLSRQFRQAAVSYRLLCAFGLRRSFFLAG